MVVTEEEREQMLEAAKPLIKWMNEHCHPHCTAHVTQNVVELTEGIATNRTDEYLEDDDSPPGAESYRGPFG